VGGVGDAVGGAVQTVVGGAWDSIVQQFADAATDMIDQLAGAWPRISRVGFDEGAIQSVYTISTLLGAVIAVFVLLISIVRTQFAADGRYVSAALAGLAKATVAIAATAVVAQNAATASGEVCEFIVARTRGDEEGFFDAVNTAAIAQGNSALTLVFAIVAIIVVVVLWAELLLVKLAIAVLVATAPLGASGLLSDRTSMWWQRQAMATFRLLLVPPSMTLCFALGFSEVRHAEGVEQIIVGLMTLAAAVLCWPALARFFAIDVDGQVSGGLGLLIGAASGLGSRFSSMGGGAGGGDPLDPVALQRMGGAGAQAGGAAGAAGAGAAGAATAGLAFLPMAAMAATAAVGGFQRGLGRTAAHAGLGGVGESVDTPWLRGGGRRPTAGGAGAPPSQAAAPQPAAPQGRNGPQTGAMPDGPAPGGYEPGPPPELDDGDAAAAVIGPPPRPAGPPPAAQGRRPPSPPSLPRGGGDRP